MSNCQHCFNYQPYNNHYNQRLGGILVPFLGGLLIGGIGSYAINKSGNNYYPYYQPYPYYPTYSQGTYPYPYATNGFYHY